MIGVFDYRRVFLATDSTFLYDGTAWTSYPPVYNGGPRRPVQYGEDLYTGMYEGASVWKFRYGSWTSAFSPPEQRAGSRHSMAVSQASLWYGTHWNGKLYRWNGSSYTVFSTGSMEVCPVIEYDSTAYAFTNETGEGKMFRYNAATGNLDEVMILSPFYHTLDAVVYDGKLYMSNYLNPHGVVEVYDGTSKSQVWDRGDNTWPMYYAVSGDSLFVTVWNETESKSEIWLSTNGSTFAQIYSHPLTGGANQIGSIQAYKGDLFFSTAQYTYRINLGAESLTESSIRLLAPNGGESVHAGDSVEVRFIASYPGQVIAEWTTSDGHPWNAFDTVEVAGDTISCWLVPSSTSLWWKVRVSYAGNRELKDESDSVFVVAPLPPRLLAPADGSDNQPLSVSLEWEYVEGTNGAGIQLALDSLFTQVVLRDTVYEAPLTSYTVFDLQRDTQYYWSIWACLQNAHGRPATPRTFRTLGTVEVSSPEIVFGDIAVGDSATATLAIRNVSRSASRALQIGLAAASSRFSISPSGEVDCPPGDSVMVTVMFRPIAYGRAQDSLIITSMSDVVHVPIEGESASPEISVVTRLLVFDQVRRGNSAIGSFRVTSTSANPFFLDTMRTTTSAFRVSYVYGPIRRGDTLEAQVVFNPGTYGVFTDTLMGVLGAFEGPLALVFGRSPWPFLDADPPSGHFQETPVGSRDTIDLILRDTTVNRATVDSITFSLSVFSATCVPFAGGADSSLCRIVFAPTAAGAYADTMFIWADVERGFVAVPVFGSGASVSVVTLEDLSVPKEFVVTQNYPNPFNPSTTIRLGVPEESSVRVVVIDMAGRQIAVLAEGVRKAGWHQSVWRASVASGVYFLRVEATPVSRPQDAKTRTLKMLLLR